MEKSLRMLGALAAAGEYRMVLTATADFLELRYDEKS
jgi:hypothetical protein